MAPYADRSCQARCPCCQRARRWGPPALPRPWSARRPAGCRRRRSGPPRSGGSRAARCGCELGSSSASLSVLLFWVVRVLWVMRDSEPLSLPSPAGSGSARGEAPAVSVPRERRAGGRRLHVTEGLRRDVHAQLLIKGEGGKRRRPEPLHFGVEGSLVVTVGGPGSRRLPDVQ